MRKIASAYLGPLLGEAIAARGIPMVGFNSLKYFWTPRTPEKAAGDVVRLIDHYLKTWKREKLILIGYSFGADVLPFLVNRFPEEIRARINLVVLLGPSMSAQFEFHLSNWFEGTSKNALPTLPEVKRMKPKKLACLYGDDESDSLCCSLNASEAQIVKLPGGHHFDGDYPALAGKILSLVGLHGSFNERTEE
jgi:type IV secretory pathway VirJ component